MSTTNGKANNPATNNVFNSSIAILMKAYREAPVGLCVFDRELRYLFINDWLANVNEKTAEQHIGKRVGDIIPNPEIAAQVESQIRSVLESGNPIHSGIAEADDPKNTDQKIIFQHDYYPVMEGGKIVGISCVVQNITEQRLTKKLRKEIQQRIEIEGELRENEKRFRDLLESAPDATIFTDLDGVIVLVNAQTEYLTGYSSEELLGQKIEKLIPAKLHKIHISHRKFFADSPSARTMGKGLDLTCTSKNGDEIPVEISLCLIDTVNGPVVASSIRDISERKTAELLARKYQTDLAQSERFHNLSEMSAGIAHEINQPIGAIAMYASSLKNLLEKPKHNMGQLLSVAESLVTLALRSGEIVKQMRNFAGQQKLAFEVISLNKIISDLLVILKPELNLHGVAIEVELPSDEIKILAAPIQIQQVLANLILNAMEAMLELPSEQRKVILSAACCNDQVNVTVRDCGVGVKEENLDVIFDRFFSTNPEGLGLGLAISRTIIETHGGLLEARRNDGGGMSFKFTLPQADSRS